jgi:hypothetical protein
VKVFRIKSDVNNYQWLVPNVPDSEILGYTTFDCRSRSSQWNQPPLSLLDSRGKAGAFVHYDPGVLVANPQTARKVRHFFQQSGELLPLWFDGDEYTILNVLTCIDSLDHSKTEWLLDADGSKVEILKYSFDAAKLLGPSIFKIPETCRGSVLTSEVSHSPDLEFKAYVEHYGLSGLLFEELWDSEKQ